MGKFHLNRTSILVGNALRWLLTRPGILEFDLDTQSLAVIEKPSDVPLISGYCGQRMAYLASPFLSGYDIQLWERKVHSDGIARWVLGKTVDLDKLLSLGSSMERWRPLIMWFAEDKFLYCRQGHWQWR